MNCYLCRSSTNWCTEESHSRRKPCSGKTNRTTGTTRQCTKLTIVGRKGWICR